MTPDYRVLVCGGGYGGAAAARELAREGIGDVLVVDRRGRAGYPPQSTSGIASYWLDRLGMRPADASVASAIRDFRLSVDGDPPGTDRHLRGFAGREAGVVLHEYDFVGRLEREAVAGGATFVHGATVLDARPVPSGFAANVRSPGEADRTVTCRWLLDAGGYNARLSRDFGVSKKLDPEDWHQGLEQTIPNGGRAPADTVSLYMGRTTAPNGYAWVFPATEGGGPALRVGIGTPLSVKDAAGRTVPTNVFYQRFLRAHPELDTKPLHRMGGVIPTARPRRRLHRGRFLSIGDAARLCSPLHGGGIAQALASGTAAAHAIAAEAPSQYERELAPYISEMRTHWMMKQFVLSMDDERMRRVLDALCDLDLDISPGANPFDLRRQALRALRRRGVRPLLSLIGSGRFFRALFG